MKDSLRGVVPTAAIHITADTTLTALLASPMPTHAIPVITGCRVSCSVEVLPPLIAQIFITIHTTNDEPAVEQNANRAQSESLSNFTDSELMPIAADPSSQATKNIAYMMASKCR